MKRKAVIILLACLTAAGASGTWAAQTEALTEAGTEAESETEPAFEISDYLQITDDQYKHLTVEVSPAAEVTDEEIQQEIVAEASAAGLDKQTEGTVAEGDTVNIDYTGKKDGVAFDGGTASDQDLEIGSGQFIPGFEDGLIGKKVGDTVDLNLTFPEDYGSADLAGQDVVFTVTINYIHQTPEITDELAGELSDGAYTTAEDYLASVKEKLQQDNDQSHTYEVWSAIYQQLADLYPIEEYPQANIDYLVGQVVSQIEDYASAAGEDVDDYLSDSYGEGTTLEDLKSYYTISAQQTLQQQILLGAIAEKEGITLSDDEFQDILQGYADQYGMTVEEMLGYWNEDSVRESELENKVMEYLESVTTVKETDETEADTEPVFEATGEGDTGADDAQTES